MVGRAFCVKIDFDLHAVTCPGVWLCPNGKVVMKIHIFDTCVATHKLSPVFPLLYHNKFTFKKVFASVITLAELEKKLSEEYIFAEMLQCSPTANRNVSLATFETNLVDLLYPVPCFKGLLAGIDVDLLMEPSKFFPGILSPKIEVSTRTTIEEVTDFDVQPPKAHIINPKVINSLNQSCIHKRKVSPPIKRVLRQKRVCHSRQGKQDSSYISRLCRKRQKNVEVVHDCNCESPNQCLLPLKDQCYLSESEKRQTCSYATNSPRSRENYSICNDAHIFDSCPICFKYKCYFSNKKSESDSLAKLYDLSNYQNSRIQCKESKPKLLSTLNSNSISNNCKNNVSQLSNAIHSLDLQNDIRKSAFKLENDDLCPKRSTAEKYKNHSMYRSTSVPSLKDDQTRSILLAKIKQLEETKEKLNSNRLERDLENSPSCECSQNNEARKGFYKNLEKFYKRMYKQAKKRAHDLEDC